MSDIVSQSAAALMCSALSEEGADADGDLEGTEATCEDERRSRGVSEGEEPSRIAALIGLNSASSSVFQLQRTQIQQQLSTSLRRR